MLELVYSLFFHVDIEMNTHVVMKCWLVSGLISGYRTGRKKYA